MQKSLVKDPIQWPPAGLLRRLCAIVYDTLLLLGVLFVATALLLPLTEGEAIKPGNPFFSTYLFFICFFFYGWFWTHGGQTLGMRAWKIRVQSFDGWGISWWQALLRFLAAMVSWLALGLGFLWMLLDKDKMTWHDRFSQSVLVVVKPRR
jgi:uncharacterized RDD family membrane protein YckC